MHLKRREICIQLIAQPEQRSARLTIECRAVEGSHRATELEQAMALSDAVIAQVRGSLLLQRSGLLLDHLFEAIDRHDEGRQRRSRGGGKRGSRLRRRVGEWCAERKQREALGGR